MDVLLLISRIELCIFTVLTLILPLVYAYEARGWWKFPDGKPNSSGRFLMAIFGAMAAATAVSAITLIFKLTPWVVLLRGVAYLLLIAVFFALITVIIRIQESEYRKDQEKRHEDAESED